ncbi:MAG TPA: TonB-dependent receptor plug domain-containing protein [Longimicrobium sp.]
MRYRWLPLPAMALLALAACGPVIPQPGGPEPDPDARAFGRAIVMDGDDLDAHTTNLLTVLRRRISGMQVSYSGSSHCPDVVLRSRKSIFGDNSPIVYVDGARVSNTCVLEQLQPSDVSRIEVYVQGITPRSGYESHANGLILVFMRTGET